MEEVYQEMLDILKKVRRVMRSEAWEQWQGAAMQTHLRAKGYDAVGYGEGCENVEYLPTVEKLDEVIEKAETRAMGK